MTSFPNSRTASAVDERGVPLSYAQESLWLADRMSRQDGPAYNEPLGFRVSGELRVGALRQALHRVVERHESLRTAFVETTDGLHAVVQDRFADFVEVADLRRLSTEDSHSRAEELITNSYRRPFDLGTGPMLRAIIVLLADDESIIGLTVHHIATDGWSNSIILDEIHKEYTSLCQSRGPADLPELTVQYTDYARGLRQDFERGGFTEKIEYWKSVLDDRPELLRLPVDHSRPPSQTFNGSTCSVSVPKEDIAALFDLCRRECRSTDFVVLLSAYAVLLNRYTGQNAVTIGTTVLNRNSDDVLNVVGCFINTAALALDLDENMTFREFLAQAANVSHTMLNHGDAPYPKVLESLNIQIDPSHNPVFQTMLTLLGKRPVLDLGGGTTCRPFPVKRVAAKFEVLVYVSEYDENVEFEVEFNTDLFNADTIERMMRHYAHLLKRLATDIDAKISSVSFLPDDEKSLILDVWNDTSVEYSRSTVVDAFEAQAEKTPDAIAVEFEDESLTYDELNRLANQVARFLIEKRKACSTPFVGVYMERSLEMVVALLAIVKAGCAYVPIDPEYPADRIDFMIEDARLSLILTQERHRSDLRDGQAEVVVLSTEEPRVEEAANVVRDLSPDSPVYMIYTSGSTGRPKGAINRHVSLFNRLYWMQTEYGLMADDRILQQTPFSFDVSVWEFFWPLMFGARIVVAKPGGHRDADYMKHVIHDKKITTIHFIASMLNVFLEEDELASFCGSLRRVICSGEALPYKAVEKFYANLTCGLHNLYGPTEAAIDVSYWPCSLDYVGKVVPIGKPIANVQLYVVDKHMCLQPIGVPGELCIGGVGLATGYHNRDDLTRKLFVKDPFAHEPDARLYRTGDLARYLPDGQIQYLGRIDNQIKVRGVRIEPEEVIAALVSLEQVKDATVVLHETAGSRMLVGYVVASEFDQQVIKDQLRERLPDFMIPQVIIEIQSMPTTANGKLDRRALPDPFAHVQLDDEVTGPSSPEEEVLVKIWADVLGLDGTGVNANFFRYGGDSILSIRVAAQLRELGYAVEVHDIFAHPTIRRLAEVMKTRRTTVTGPAETPFCLVDAADREKLPADVDDAWPLTMLQSGMIYHTMLQEKTSVYHDIFDFELAAKVHPDQVHEVVRSIFALHPQLRSTFDLDNFSQPLQIVHADAAVPLEIIDVTPLPRQQQDGAIERWIAAEKQRQFDVRHGPLVRLRAHVRSRDEMNLAISFHHALLDGWSVAVVLDEFRRVYAGLIGQRHPELGPEQVPYSTYVNLERQALRDSTQASFWSDRLAGFRFSALPRSNNGGADERPAAPASAERVVPEPLASAVQTFAGELGVPLKCVYLALHLNVLGRILNRRDVVSGLVANGRPETQGSEELVGLFLNTLPFPIELRQESWSALVERVFELELGSVAHRRFPLAGILRLTGKSALFDIVFNYTDFHVYRGGDNDGEVKILSARYFEHTNFDAVVHAHRDYFSPEMRLVVNYDSARLNRELIERYLDYYLAAVADLTSNAAVVRVAGATVKREPETSDARTAPRPRRAAHVAPRTALERRIAEIVSQAIGVENLGIDDNYLELGVDSITVIQVVAKIKKLNPELTMKEVFAQRTIRELAQQVEAGRGTGSATRRLVRPFELAGSQERPFPPAVIDAYPATSMQLDMIRETDQDVAQATYHDVFSYHLTVPLDEALLRAGLSRVMNGHDTFRTAFSLDGYSVPMQLVYETVQPHLEVFDLSSLPGEQRESSFDDWFERERRTGFDWSEPGQIRLYAHRRSATDFTLTLSFHHSIIDGWSLSLFIRDLIEVYVAALNHEDEPSLTLPTLKYRDYVRTEVESRSSRELRDFWQEKLHGYTYNSLPRPTRNGHGARWGETKIVLDEARQEALTKLSSRLGVPLKYAMLACHLRVMSLVCRESDVLTGVFTSGRLEEDEGDNVLGLFLNFIPFRQRLADQTWRGFIQETFENDLQSLPYRRYPLGSIQRDLRAGADFRDRIQLHALQDVRRSRIRCGSRRGHQGHPLVRAHQCVAARKCGPRRRAGAADHHAQR
jgi:amino acid adenylation domain-containing protein